MYVLYCEVFCSVRGVNEVWLLQAGAEEFHTTPRDCDFEQATVKIIEVHRMCIRCLCDFSHISPEVCLCFSCLSQ